MSERRSPFPPGPRGPVYVLGLMGALSALGLMLVAQALAGGISAIAAGQGHDAGWLATAALLAVGGAVLRSVAAWGQAVAARRMVVEVKENLRGSVLTALLAGRRPARSAGQGADTLLVTRRLDELDKYYTEYLPALVSCATVPLLVGARILFADWLSALIIVLTIPLVPVFMILIGKHTQDSLRGAYRALDVMSSHMVELARGLPVLIGLGRADSQKKALADVGEKHREESMKTLKTAFLSALALEMIATISVALVAVTIGVRLVNGQMPLEAGLIALILAPECYTALRALGTAYHASEDGKLALDAVDSLNVAPTQGRVLMVLEPAESGLHLSGLSLEYPSSGLKIGPVTASLEAGAVTAFTGPSGCGKSSLLTAIAGTADPDALLEGELHGTAAPSIAFAPQHPAFLQGLVREEVEYALINAKEGNPSGTSGEPDRGSVDIVNRALDLAGARALELREVVTLSPGEQRRVAVARAFARALAGADLLILDEPTAHLDELSAATVRASITELSARLPILLVTHDPATAELASHVIPVAAGHVDPAAPASASTPLKASAERSGASLRSAAEQPGSSLAQASEASSAKAGADLLKGNRVRLFFGVFLGVLAQLFSVALAALSGWLIVHAASHPPILYLMAAIVGVRFFGIGRAVLRYTERLATHDAVFRLTDRLRGGLWSSLSTKALSIRRLMQGGNVLDSVVGTVDEYRDLVPRTLAPTWTAAGTSVLAVVATWFVLPAAVPVVVTVVLISLVVAPWVARTADALAARQVLAAKSGLLRFVSAAVLARTDLAANALSSRAVQDAQELSATMAHHARRSAWADGLGQAVSVLFTVAGAGLVPLLAVQSLGAGQQSAERAAVVALMLLALLEPFQAHLAAVRLRPALHSLADRLSADLAPQPPLEGSGVRSEDPSATPAALIFSDLSVAWPDSVPVFEGLNGQAREGLSLGVSGPSGSGKSTLLAGLLGFLPPAAGEIRVAGRMAWCPQEAHVFDSSIRGNLALARPRGQVVGTGSMWSVLDRVGLGEYVRSLPDGLDSRIGPGGSHLSGGQRQRLAMARTLMSEATVLLVDEPTAHLDAEAADALMADLSRSVDSEALVVVSHRAEDLAHLDQRIEFSAARVSR